jgi:hypothetical protein
MNISEDARTSRSSFDINKTDMRPMEFTVKWIIGENGGIEKISYISFRNNGSNPDSLNRGTILHV